MTTNTFITDQEKIEICQERIKQLQQELQEFGDLKKVYYKQIEISEKLESENTRYKETLKWIYEYIHRYCIIIHPKTNTEGREPEQVIKEKIKKAFKN